MAMVRLATAAAALPSLPAAATPSSSSPSAKLLPRDGGGRDAVYVAAVPLRAAAGPAQMVASAVYSVGLWELQHFMVIVDRCVGCSSERWATVFDFQPRDPENIYVLLSALSHKRVPGVILKRTLDRVPRSRCWFVGFSDTDGVKASDKFNEEWDTDLVLGIHDCRHYTNGLVEQLTGEVNILEHLRTKPLGS